MSAEVTYRVDIVGGPFDGIGGLYWTDDGEHPPPDTLYLGTCPGNGQCMAGNVAQCVRWANRTGRKLAHPAFWVEAEDTRPSNCVTYAKRDIVPARFASENPRVVYAIGGLDPSGGTSIDEDEPLYVDDILKGDPAPDPQRERERELVPTGELDWTEYALPPQHDLTLHHLHLAWEPPCPGYHPHCRCVLFPLDPRAAAVRSDRCGPRPDPAAPPPLGPGLSDQRADRPPAEEA